MRQDLVKVAERASGPLSIWEKRENLGSDQAGLKVEERQHSSERVFCFVFSGVIKIYTPRKYGHPGVPISRDFDGTPS